MNTFADISTVDVDMALLLPDFTDDTMLSAVSEPPDDIQTGFTGFPEPELPTPVTPSKFYGEGASCGTEAEFVLLALLLTLFFECRE